MLKAMIGTSPLYPLPVSTWGCTPGVKNKKNIPYFSLYGQVQCHLSDITQTAMSGKKLCKVRLIIHSRHEINRIDIYFLL
jgi:hypothetical protein